MFPFVDRAFVLSFVNPKYGATRATQKLESLLILTGPLALKTTLIWVRAEVDCNFYLTAYEHSGNEICRRASK